MAAKLLLISLVQA